MRSKIELQTMAREETDGLPLPLDTGLIEAEAYANNSTIFELEGSVRLAETVYAMARRNGLRNRLSIPTGQLTLRHAIPPFNPS